MFTLVLMAAIYGGYMPTVAGRYVDAESCEAAGNAWQHGVASTLSRAPGYVCIPAGVAARGL